MAKEVENNICTFCESQYKLSYDAEASSGKPKFCPFCASENYEEPDEYNQDEK